MFDIQKIKKAFKLSWYTQGFNAVPLFLNSCAWSGMTMKKTVGFGYTRFLHHYQNGYGEMSYWLKDFHRIWNIIKNKLSKNPHYLQQTKKLYEQRLRPYKKIFLFTDKADLKKISDKQLLYLFQQCAKGLEESVGIAHMMDAFSVEAEREFKHRLYLEIAETKSINKYAAILSAPSQPSFLKKKKKL